MLQLPWALPVLESWLQYWALPIHLMGMWVQGSALPRTSTFLLALLPFLNPGF